jgi:hypothetical protein
MCDESWESALRLVELCGGHPQVVREGARMRSLSPELVAHACRLALDIAAREHHQPAPFRKWRLHQGVSMSRSSTRISTGSTPYGFRTRSPTA